MFQEDLCEIYGEDNYEFNHRLLIKKLGMFLLSLAHGEEPDSFKEACEKEEIKESLKD